ETEPADAGDARLSALRSVRRILRGSGSLLCPVPLGEPDAYGWWGQRGRTGLGRALPPWGVLRRGAGDLRADSRGLARGAGLRPARRPLRGARAGSISRSLRRSPPRKIPQAGDAARPADRGAPPRRSYLPARTARRGSLESERWTSSSRLSRGRSRGSHAGRRRPGS